MRERSAPSSDRAAASISSLRVRAREAMRGPRTSRQMLLMAAKSPGEAMAKPASMISTPRASRAWAMRSFSGVVMLQPGDCSPSRRVVSKKKTDPGRSARLGESLVHGGAAFRILFIIIFAGFCMHRSNL